MSFAGHTIKGFQLPHLYIMQHLLAARSFIVVFFLLRPDIFNNSKELCFLLFFSIQQKKY